MVEQDTKPPAQTRRNFYSEESDRLQYNYDAKIPFPQSQYYPPRLSVRGMPMKAFGGIATDPGTSTQEMHHGDPRYLPQDMSHEDKRFRNYYGYPIQSLAPGHGGMMGFLNPNQAGMMNNGLPGGIPTTMTIGIGSVGVGAGVNMGTGIGMGTMNSGIGPNMNSGMSAGMGGAGTGPGSVASNLGPNSNQVAGSGNGINIGQDGNPSSNTRVAMRPQMSLGSGIGPIPVLVNSGQHSSSLPNMQGGMMSSVPTSMGSTMGNNNEADYSMTTTNTDGSKMMRNNQQSSIFPGKLEEGGGLVSPIPPLHVQQQLVNKEDEHRKIDSDNQIQSKCSRCKKEFTQSLLVAKDSFMGKFGTEPKIFKLCDHCRDLQRERLRRWQKKTKDKQGACRRCGNEIPLDQQKYVLCPLCRQNLRIRKANRAAQGKCVHCSGPINLLIINDENGDENGRRPSVAGGFYKVCQRCRENDKIRRTNLERMGNCNRCAKALSSEERGRHKVCLNCRQKKKKISNVPFYGGFSGVPSSMVAMDNSQQQMSIPPPQKNMISHMNYMPVDQNSMMGFAPVNPMINVGGHIHQQDYVPPYPQMIQLPDMYKAQMAQFPVQQQPDQN